MKDYLYVTSEVKVWYCVGGYEYLVTYNVDTYDDWSFIDYIFDMSCENLIESDASREVRDVDDYDDGVYKTVNIERAVKKAYEVSYDLIEKYNQMWECDEEIDPMLKVTDIRIKVV